MNEVLSFLQNRNSAPRLAEPAPSEAEMAQMFAAAVRVPDHAWLRPWRFITVSGDRRRALGQVFSETLLLRQPEADEAARAKAANAPLRAPVIVVVVTRITQHPKVPPVEQRQSAACAAYALLLAAEAMGYAGIWRTGDPAFDPEVMKALGLAGNEEIAGFLYIGSREGLPKPVPELNAGEFVSNW